MRALIATVTAGAGHLQAAAAIKEAWISKRPGDTVEVIDLLEMVSPLQRKIYTKTYLNLVTYMPQIWGMIFAGTDDPKWVEKNTRFRRTFARATNTSFVRKLEAVQPDVVIATHYLPLEILGHLKSRRDHFDPFTLCVVTDFDAHALWMENAVDLYCVAAEQTRECLLSRAVAPEKIEVTGIPISQRFAKKIPSDEARRFLGLKSDRPVLLLLSGGFGTGPVEDLFHALQRVKTRSQIVVVCGKNSKLKEELERLPAHHPTTILGFVTNMEVLMAAADLIITKPGGLTSSEALALHKPLIMVHPIPGQEAANADFLLEQGVASKINRTEDLPWRVDRLLDSPKLQEMAKAARGVGRPQAAMAICQLAWERYTAR